jgi:hypothetical protein
MTDLAQHPNGVADPDAVRLNIPVPKDLMRQLKSLAALEALPLYLYVNRILAAKCAKAPVKPTNRRS